MPRKNPLAESEVRICRRLLQARQASHLTRAAVARLLGIGVKTYANYERASAALPMSVARAFCSHLDISECWLAEGAEPRRGHVPMDALLASDLPRRVLFSVAWERVFRKAMEQRLGEISAAGEALHSQGAAKSKALGLRALGSSAQALPYSIEMIRAMAGRLPTFLHWALFDAIVAASRELDKNYAKEIAEHLDKQRNSPGVPRTSAIDMKYKHVYSSSVPKTLDDLLGVAEKFTLAHGQAKLAKVLDVTQATLSRWINKEVAPNGEATLKLFYWVEKNASTNESPGVAKTTPGQTKPRTASSYEQSKPQSGRKKR